MNKHLLQRFRTIKSLHKTFDYDYIPMVRSAADYRTVLVFRNIYDSLVSGKYTSDS